MAKPGPKKSEVEPVKFGMTAYLVRGKHDILIEWIEGVPANERWGKMRDLMISALMREQMELEDVSDEPPEWATELIMISNLMREQMERYDARDETPEWATELTREFRRLSAAVARLESSGMTVVGSEVAPEPNEPSERSKAATAKLFAKTRE